MRWAFLTTTVVLASVVAGSGCRSGAPSAESEGERIGSTAQRIQDGKLDTTSTFAVGVCAGNPGKCFGICSGALILPNVVATARHCIDQTPEQIDCSKNPTFGARTTGTFNVTVNPTLEAAASGWYSVKSLGVPDDDHICGNDIALLVLSKSIPSNVAKPVTPGVQYLMWDPAAAYLKSFTAVGYGNTSAGEGATGSGTRRIRKLINVLCIPGSPTLDCPPELSENEFISSGGTCSGDSGSSAYEQNSFDKGAPVSFGVLSRGSDENGNCGPGVYTRFDAHRDFVIDVAKAASDDWTLYDEPSWTAAKPKPSPTADAGTKKDAGTAPPPAKGAIGDTCEKASDCSSALCVDPGDESFVCSQECSDTDECPSDFECREERCLPHLAAETPTAATSDTSASSCAASPLPSSASSAATLALPALGLAMLALGRRRQRR